MTSSLQSCFSTHYASNEYSQSDPRSQWNQRAASGVGIHVGVHPRSPGIPGFEYLYAVTLLVVAIPMAMINQTAFRFYPHSVGFNLRITNPASLMADHEGRLFLTVKCAKEPTFPANELEFHLNSRLVSSVDLGVAVRAELSRRAHRVVYLEGDGCLQLGDIVRVIDIVRDAWYGVPVVLLTPNSHRHGGAR